MASRATKDRSEATRSYNPEQTKEQLIATAIELFGRQGFHATSVREIVDAAELTKGAFYHHFESKEDLLHMIHDEFIEFHLAGQHLVFEQVDTPHERLYHLVRLLVLVVAEYTSQVSIYFQEHRALAGDDFADVHAKRTAAREGFVEVIEEGVRRGDFRSDVDPTIAALGVLGMGNWVYQWYPDRKGRSAEDIGSLYGSMALRALTAKPRVASNVAKRKRAAGKDPVRILLERRRTDKDGRVLS